ncbi:hypothetical protein CRG98_019942 [Punica granatum]|uniref:Leucine-rich repeat-containing N-terminal plant-type domain-containing protein n=1 Tax=Punica granatum TaxID=22663 RepID=A0A2I0JTN9_PUNGR|nr:hypothetical protein CRG98_019942 [Punica granatum]
MRPGLVFFCLFFLFFESSMSIPMPSPFTRFLGHADQCNALLQFASSLGITTNIDSKYFCNIDGANITSYPKTASWRKGTDCCTWDGIMCDYVTGDVIVVDLTCSCLRGTLRPNSTLFMLSNVRTLYLRGGKLPRFLANCSKLKTLDLSNNELQDSFPSWLEALPSLYILVLRSNKFHGPVNTSGSPQPFSKLQIFDLSNNNFHGAFPTQYVASFKGMRGGDEKRGNFVDRVLDNQIFDTASVIGKGVMLELIKIQKAFSVIDLSCNHFQGKIPDVIGDLKLLTGLNFSQNNLTGPIPYSFGNLTNLEWLDLSLNNLSGEIPGSLADLTSLAYLNLSMNRLMGPIPKGKQFNTFKSDSFGGNPGLYYMPLNLPFPLLELTKRP